MENEKEILPDVIDTGDVLVGVQICPFGEFAKGSVNQVCDRTAFEQIVRAFEGGGSKEVLCDFEHKSASEDPTSDTSAAAWISGVRVDDEKGLVGDFRWTDEGAEAVSGRRLRFLSPVWTLDGAGRPDHLISVALTNKPNIPVSCVLNREEVAVSSVEEKEGPKMDKLKELLGLGPEAGEAEIVGAVQGLLDRLAEANKEKEEAAAEGFAEAHKGVCNKEALKSAYLLNKAAAEALVAGLVVPSKATGPLEQVVLNKDAGEAPVVTMRARLAELPARERAAFFNAHKNEF